MDSRQLMSESLARYMVQVTNLAIGNGLSRLKKNRAGFAAHLNARLSKFATDVSVVAETGHEGSDSRGISFGNYIPLSLRYKQKKLNDGVISSLQSNAYHHFTGNLAKALKGIDVTESNRWGKVLVKDIEITINKGVWETEFTRRGKVSFQGRNSLGQFGSKLTGDLKYFTISVPIFKKLQDRSKGYPEYLMFQGDFKEGNNALAKLMGYTKMSKRTGRTWYRPLVPYYLNWYYDVVVPQLIRSYQWPQ